MARGFSSNPDRRIRIQRVPGVWEEVLECDYCGGSGVAEVEEAVPDYRSGSDYLIESLGECPVCEGRGYVELPEEIDDET